MTCDDIEPKHDGNARDLAVRLPWSFEMDP